MVEVRLHGPLAQAFGMKWMLDISTPAEAIHAIEANKPGIRKLIRELSTKGLVFRVRSKDHDYDNDDVTTTLGRTKRIDIIPIVRGSGPGVRFVVGAILVVVGYVVSAIPGGQVFGPAMIGLGMSLMLGAVTEWLTQIPKKDEATANKKSWTLEGPTNTADQGAPVPIIYGEVLTGGYPISAGISASQLTSGGTIDPSVEITGIRDVVAGISGRASSGWTPWTRAVDMRLSAAPFNLGEPFTYAWSFSVISSELDTPLSVVVMNGTGPTVTFRITGTVTSQAAYGGEEDLTPGHRVDCTVTLVITGTEQDRSGSGTPSTLTRSVTVPVSVSFVDNRRFF